MASRFFPNYFQRTRSTMIRPLSHLYTSSHSCLSEFMLEPLEVIWSSSNIECYFTASYFVPGRGIHSSTSGKFLPIFQDPSQVPFLEICPTCARWARLPTPSSTSLLFYWPLVLHLPHSPGEVCLQVWLPTTDLPWFMMGLRPDKPTLNWKCHKSKCI